MPSSDRPVETTIPVTAVRRGDRVWDRHSRSYVLVRTIAEYPKTRRFWGVTEADRVLLVEHRKSSQARVRR